MSLEDLKFTGKDLFMIIGFVGSITAQYFSISAQLNGLERSFQEYRDRVDEVEQKNKEIINLQIKAIEVRITAIELRLEKMRR